MPYALPLSLHGQHNRDAAEYVFAIDDNNATGNPVQKRIDVYNYVSNSSQTALNFSFLSQLTGGVFGAQILQPRVIAQGNRAATHFSFSSPILVNGVDRPNIVAVADLSTVDRVGLIIDNYLFQRLIPSTPAISAVSPNLTAVAYARRDVITGAEALMFGVCGP